MATDPDHATLRVLATAVGRPSALGRADGGVVLSSIAKDVVAGPTLELDDLNLAGDDQADRTVHGGVDKAVYSYPSEHWGWWRDELDLPVGRGSFGENLTTAGLLEDEVAIGDRFRWGGAVVEVSQPRSPCFKLALHLGRPDVLKAMVRSARTGWYWRTIEGGTVPSTGDLVRVHHDPAAPTIRDVFTETYGRTIDRDRATWILGQPALADQWAAALRHRLGADRFDE